MICRNCQKELTAEMIFCCYCGAKQNNKETGERKRDRGSGTICFDKRYKNPYIAHAPSDSTGARRKYLGAFPDYESAQRAVNEYIEKGSADMRNSTVKEVYERWSDTHYGGIAERTAETCRSYWKHLSPIAGMRMCDVRMAHIQNIINEHPGPGVSRGIKSLAKALFRYAAENDITDKNYAEYVKLPKQKRSEKVIFSAEQIAKLWDNSSDMRVQAILIMIYMGFRIGEISTLKTSGVYLDEGYVVCGEKTEAGRNRLIPFPRHIPEIKEFVARRVRNAGFDGRLYPYTEHGFRNSIFYRTLIDLGMLEANVKDGHIIFHTSQHLTPHSTRHTFASLSVAAGIRPESLQKIIGHASFRTTADIYVHIDSEMLIGEMDKLKR